MVIAFRFLGCTVATVGTFIAVFALAFWITNGSTWVMAFFPLAIGAAGSVAIMLGKPLFDDLEGDNDS